MRFCNFRKVLCRIVAFIAVYNFSLRVLPTGLSGLRIARTNENEALRNGGFFRLFSWNSDYQKCMNGGKSSHRSSFFLEGLGIIVCRPERKATLRYCILFDGSMRNASRLYRNIIAEYCHWASSLRCVVLRKQRHAFSMMRAAV